MNKIVDFKKKQEEKNVLKQTCEALDEIITITTVDGKKITFEELLKLNKK